MNEGYLEHHGILGMKWGVRRFQNYDGSYTQKGMERYRKNEQKYNEANANYKKTKSDLKKGTATQTDVANAKIKRTAAKNELSKSYDRLKFDKKADKGKKLYQKGKTVEGIENRNTALLKASGVATTIAALATSGSDAMVRMGTKFLPLNQVAPTAVAAGSLFITGLSAAKGAIDKRKMRAYWHSSIKDA